MKISSLLIKPTGPDCNLDCIYCFYNCKGELFAENKVHRMSQVTLEKTIKDYMAVCEDNAVFGWQGGEPTLVGLEFFEKAVFYINKYKTSKQTVSMSLQTNGILIDEDWAMFLKKNNFLVGISIDGPTDVHDENRIRFDGSPSHSLVESKMKMLKEFGVEFNTMTVITKTNVNRPEEIFDYLKKNGSGYMQFIPCVEIDRKNGGIAYFTPTPEEFGEFLCRVFDRWIGRGMPENYVRFFDEMLISYVDYKAASCYFASYCVANLVVEHNGDVFPCDFFVDPEWKLGNINVQDFKQLISNPKMKEFKNRKRILDNKCDKCKWRSLCWGDCCKYRLNQDGESIKSAYFCAGFKKFFEYSQPKMIEIKKKLLESNDRRAALWRKREDYLSRYDNCPCESGLKYKDCCMSVKGLF